MKRRRMNAMGFSMKYAKAGVAIGVGSGIIGAVSSNVASPVTQSVLGSAGPLMGAGMLGSMAKDIDKMTRTRKRR